MKPTQEQVIAWAREVGLTDWETSSYGNQLEWFAALAYAAGRKDENEACAKLCADIWCELPEPGDARDCYDAIRARREQ